MTISKCFSILKCFVKVETKSLNFSCVRVHLSKIPRFQLISEDPLTATSVEKQIQKVFHPRFIQKLIFVVISNASQKFPFILKILVFFSSEDFFG